MRPLTPTEAEAFRLRSIAILSVVASAKGYGPEVLFEDRTRKYFRRAASAHLDRICPHIADNIRKAG